MENTSIWLKNLKFDSIKSLTKNIELDVLIIGGGITGLSTAYNLIGKDLEVAVVERNIIGHGITSKTTGKVTYLQENIYSKLKKYHSEEKAKLYLESQLEAIYGLEKIIEDNKIDCDFQKTKSYLFTRDLDKVKLVKQEEKQLNKFGIKTEATKVLPSNESCNYAISVSNTAIFHPLKYLIALKKICKKNKIEIYEDTKIEKIDKINDYYICKTKDYIIRAKYVVLALHYPYFLFPFFMPGKVTLEKSYITASEVPASFDFNAINTNKPTESIRYHSSDNTNYEIRLYCSHNISVKNNEEENFDSQENKSALENSYKWSNIDIITSDYLPYIGRVKDNLLIGTGYNTWGMTNGVLAGKIISDIILNKDNKYIDLFNPKRGINLGKIVNFPVIIGSNIKSFIASKINKNKSWYKDNVRFEKRNGNNIAVYIDENGQEHIVYNKCPHVKCSLVFNEVEKTWDCPCHGSRFDLDGNCIEGPSNYDICYHDK